MSAAPGAHRTTSWAAVQCEHLHQCEHQVHVSTLEWTMTRPVAETVGECRPYCEILALEIGEITALSEFSANWAADIFLVKGIIQLA